MRDRFHLRLSHKIMAIALVGLAGLLAFGAIHQMGSRWQDASRVAADSARVIADLNQRLHIDMLEARRAEKNFQHRRDETYIKRHAELVTSITRDFEQLKKSLQAGNATQLLGKAATIQEGFNNYVGSFQALAKAEITLGINEDSGLTGALRTAVRAIEARLTTVDDPRLTNGMLTMRRHEKDFMLRRNPKYVSELKNTVAEFSATLAASDVDAPTKAEITSQLEKYQKGFLAWADDAIEIAKQDAKMAGTFRAIEPVIAEFQQGIDQLRREAVDAETGVHDSIRVWLLIALGVATLMVGGTSALIGLSISRALSAMVRAMTALAGGNAGIIVPGLQRKDEIGEMAAAVSVFKDNMIETERLRREQQETEQSQAHQRKTEMNALADKFESAVGEIVEMVSSASTELEASATTLTSTAGRSEQLTTAVAAASEQASANVQSVATATEEMSSSVREISRRYRNLPGSPATRFSRRRTPMPGSENCPRRRPGSGTLSS